jgi:hypothetical protein
MRRQPAYAALDWRAAVPACCRQAQCLLAGHSYCSAPQQCGVSSGPKLNHATQYEQSCEQAAWSTGGRRGQSLLAHHSPPWGSRVGSPEPLQPRGSSSAAAMCMKIIRCPRSAARVAHCQHQSKRVVQHHAQQNGACTGDTLANHPADRLRLYDPTVPSPPPPNPHTPTPPANSRLAMTTRAHGIACSHSPESTTRTTSQPSLHDS